MTDDPGIGIGTAKRPAVRTALRAGAVALAVANGMSIGTASAASVQVSLQFNCSSVYGDIPMRAVVQADAPDSATVGKPTAEVGITATASANSPLIGLAIGATGATSVQGSGQAGTTVSSAQGTQSMTVSLFIPNTPIADSDQVTVKAFGTYPPVTYTRPGTATVSFTSLQGQLTPIRSDGSEPVGPIAVSCTLASGTGFLYRLPVLSASASSGAPQPARSSAAPITSDPVPTTSGLSPTTGSPSSGFASLTGTAWPSDSGSAGSVTTVGSASDALSVSGSTTSGGGGTRPANSGDSLTLVSAVSAGAVSLLGAGTAVFLRRRRRH